MKPIKAITLFTVLFFPVFLFLFLKFFGKNEYDLPVYYKNGIYSDCNSSKEAYQVNFNKVTEKAFSGFNNGISVTGFLKGEEEHDQLMLNELLRISDNFKNKGKLNFLIFYPEGQENKLKQFEEFFSEKVYFLNKDHEKLKYYKRCVFAFPKPGKFDEDFVLVDPEGRIRGFYDGTEKEETDRLIAEIDILLEKVH